MARDNNCAGRSGISIRNPSGLLDPTAHSAITNIQKETDDADLRAQAFIRAVKTLVDQSGYDLLARIEIRDRATGRNYR